MVRWPPSSPLEELKGEEASALSRWDWNGSESNYVLTHGQPGTGPKHTFLPCCHDTKLPALAGNSSFCRFCAARAYWSESLCTALARLLSSRLTAVPEPDVPARAAAVPGPECPRQEEQERGHPLASCRGTRHRGERAATGHWLPATVTAASKPWPGAQGAQSSSRNEAEPLRVSQNLGRY